MHEVKGRGMAVAALAVAVVDNAMVAGTGHRICNDCMTGCIYTNGNRDPVDIPQAETRILKDVLELPWGFEIYSLLIRWNPLNLRRPMPKAASGRSRPGGRPGSGRLYAGASSVERRSARGGGGRVEDRAAGGELCRA